MKKVVLLVLVLILLVVSPTSAVIYLNNIPADIVVNEGDVVNIPFFVSSEKKLVEVYFITKFKQHVLYYNGSNWIEVPSLLWNVFVRPAIDVVFLPEYIFGIFSAFESASADFEAILCVDDNINGRLDYDAECGSRQVIVKR